MRHRWLGWADAAAPPTALRFATPAGEVASPRDAVVLALGGASWSRLGSDGAWVPWLAGARRGRGAAAAGQLRLRRRGWSALLRRALRRHALQVGGDRRSRDAHGRSFARKGEFVATATGIEGSLVYAASALLRDEIAAQRQRHADARPAARPQRRAGARRGAASARRALAGQPPEEPAGPRGHQGRRAARGADARGDARRRTSWPRPSRRCRCGWSRRGPIDEAISTRRRRALRCAGRPV